MHPRTARGRGLRPRGARRRADEPPPLRPRRADGRVSGRRVRPPAGGAAVLLVAGPGPGGVLPRRRLRDAALGAVRHHRRRRRVRRLRRRLGGGVPDAGPHPRPPVGPRRPWLAGGDPRHRHRPPAGRARPGARRLVRPRPVDGTGVDAGGEEPRPGGRRQPLRHPRQRPHRGLRGRSEVSVHEPSGREPQKRREHTEAESEIPQMERTRPVSPPGERSNVAKTRPRQRPTSRRSRRRTANIVPSRSGRSRTSRAARYGLAVPTSDQTAPLSEASGALGSPPRPGASTIDSHSSPGASQSVGAPGASRHRASSSRSSAPGFSIELMSPRSSPV